MNQEVTKNDTAWNTNSNVKSNTTGHQYANGIPQFQNVECQTDAIEKCSNNVKSGDITKKIKEELDTETMVRNYFEWKKKQRKSIK